MTHGGTCYTLAMDSIVSKGFGTLGWGMVLLLVVASVLVAVGAPYGPAFIIGGTIAVLFAYNYTDVTYGIVVLSVPFLGLMVSLPTARLSIGERACGRGVARGVGIQGAVPVGQAPRRELEAVAALRDPHDRGHRHAPRLGAVRFSTRSRPGPEVYAPPGPVGLPDLRGTHGELRPVAAETHDDARRRRGDRSDRRTHGIRVARDPGRIRSALPARAPAPDPRRDAARRQPQPARRMVRGYDSDHDRALASRRGCSRQTSPRRGSPVPSARGTPHVRAHRVDRACVRGAARGVLRLAATTARLGTAALACGRVPDPARHRHGRVQFHPSRAKFHEHPLHALGHRGEPLARESVDRDGRRVVRGSDCDDPRLHP